MEFDAYFRFLLALVFVLSLIGLTGWLARRYGVGGTRTVTGRPRRVSIVEVTALDARRRLVLVRRDEVEHLLLLGAGTELVVESGIRAPAATSFSQVVESLPTEKRP